MRRATSRRHAAGMGPASAASMHRQGLSAPGWVLLLATILIFFSLGWRDRRSASSWQEIADPLGPCRGALERPGEGLVCIPALPATVPAAQAKAIPQAGDRPLSGLRGVLAGVPLDLQHASAADLAMLPEIGAVSAQSLVAAREAGRLRCQSDLAAVRGLGRHRLRRLLPFVRPLPQVCPRVHPKQ